MSFSHLPSSAYLFQIQNFGTNNLCLLLTYLCFHSVTIRVTHPTRLWVYKGVVVPAFMKQPLMQVFDPPQPQFFTCRQDQSLNYFCSNINIPRSSAGMEERDLADQGPHTGLEVGASPASVRPYWPSLCFSCFLHPEYLSHRLAMGLVPSSVLNGPLWLLYHLRFPSVLDLTLLTGNLFLCNFVFIICFKFSAWPSFHTPCSSAGLAGDGLRR